MITHHSSLEVFYEQLQYVQREYKPHGLKADSFSNVFIGGLGGSGIGATIAKGYYSQKFPIPIEVVNDYFLPAYVGEKSLVILGSYSGNTEETLAMFEEALIRKSTILIICSGGQLLKNAQDNGLTHYLIEGGFQPRMALGYALGFQLSILAELMGDDIHAAMDESIKSLQEDKEKFKSSANAFRKKFQSTLNRRFTILCDAPFYGIAVRFAQQLNENAKLEAFVNVLPEANHNVIESYYGQLPTNFVVLNSRSNERVSARFDFVVALLERENNKVATIETNGIDIQTLFEVAYILDWFTVLITEPLNVDPMQIENIISLKEFLSEI